MTNKELQISLSKYPDDMDIRLLIDHTNSMPIVSFNKENILLSSETAYVDDTAPEDEWDTEDGKVELGEGTKYLLINPIIL